MNGVYILQSTKNKRYYIGSTNNIEKRLKQHNAGYVFATKSMRPLVLALFQECDVLSDARKLERKIKNFKRKDFIEKMIRDRKIITGP
ncbi:GIY-YIG nuclease family protein [Candidatus Microgenomates bacterium]|nr:GIY-YIG nuclease family protein [Candidatus Microgenomates bacterium]